MLRRRALGIGLTLVLASAGCAGLDTSGLGQALGTVLDATTSGAPSESTVAAGLREALVIGAQNASSQTSAIDGFLGDALIRIGTPPELDRMARGLRAVGLGSEVDRFEVQMNRAAEQSAGEARAVFLDGIRGLTILDALAILRGPDDAATAHLRRTTGAELTRRFSPIVDAKMREVGLVRVYDGLLARWRQVPLAPQPELDLREYVTDRTLDGIFTVVAHEEKKIRTDPQARVTDLLRTVFAERNPL